MRNVPPGIQAMSWSAAVLAAVRSCGRAGASVTAMGKASQRILPRCRMVLYRGFTRDWAANYRAAKPGDLDRRHFGRDRDAAVGPVSAPLTLVGRSEGNPALM